MLEDGKSLVVEKNEFITRDQVFTEQLSLIKFAEAIENPDDIDSIKISLESTIGLDDVFSDPEIFREKQDPSMSIGESNLKGDLYEKMKLNRMYFIYYY